MPNDRGWLAGTRQALRPPPELSLSAWAERHFRLSTETSAQPGRWRTLPWQREVMDSITDDAVERVSLIKAARIGYTAVLSAALGYFMTHDPTTILVVQPTVDDAKNFSKETIAPMLRDVPLLSRLALRDIEDATSATLQHRAFPGGVLSLVGANSGTGFRRISRRVIMFDEVDAYPHSAGVEGDPIKLGERRAEHYWNRKIVSGSTPLVAGASRIEELFLAGDQRRFHVPCPHCGHMDFLVFQAKADRGHVMRWPDGKPEQAYFECRKCGCSIEETSKREMLEAGEWRAERPGGSHRSYAIWTAYSSSVNASWGQIAAEFLEAKGRTETLRTFVNTVLGETWQEQGEAPEWERLYNRRESYPIGTVPEGVIVLTAGVDVQQDRFVFEVVGWGANRESWSIEAGELYGDTALEATWGQLDELLARTFPGEEGESPISMLAIDSGYRTQTTYNWARRYPMSRVIAVKGVSGARMLIGTPSPVEVAVNGRKLRRGYKVWPVGVDIAKSELYGWLRLRVGEDGIAPPGYCHFPELPEEFFRQVTAEQLVTTVNKRTRRTKLEWQVQPNRQNHALDARVYARAAASVLGIDRLARKPRPSPTSRPAPTATAPEPAPAAAAPLPAPARGSWIGGRRNWLRDWRSRGR